MRQVSPVARAELAEALERQWYHTIELAPGLVTPGWFDTRGVAPRLPFPQSLAGKRCLDVATFDGYWAFEMERRGAAEVHAIDLLDPYSWDWPILSEETTVAAINARKEGGRGFELAHRALGSAVRFEERSIYDLDPSAVGEFDFVYLGSLLMHLRDPVRGLERVRSVCTGQLLLVDNVDLALTLLMPRRPVASFDGRGRPWWWKANRAGLVALLRAAGFELDGRPQLLYIPPGRGHPQRSSLRPRTLRSAEGRALALTALKGDPHAAILARPVRTRDRPAEEDAPWRP